MTKPKRPKLTERDRRARSERDRQAAKDQQRLDAEERARKRRLQSRSLLLGSGGELGTGGPQPAEGRGLGIY